MKAIILAAGRGKRMGSQTDDAPKCMTVLGGRPLLAWQTAALKGAGVTDIGIVCGYKSEKLPSEGFVRFQNTRWNETNMLRSLMCAREWLAREECVVSYADIVYPADTMTRLIEVAGDIVITYDREWLKLWEARFADPLRDAETFRIDAHGTLMEIGGRADSTDEIQGQYMGLLKFTPAGWSIVEEYLRPLEPAEVDHLDMTALIQRLIRNGAIISTVPISGRWFEVDSEEDVRLWKRLYPQKPF